MSVVYVRPAVSATVPGVTEAVTVKGGQVTLDALTAPYAVADLEVPLVPDELDDLDPRDNLRVIVTAGDDVAGTSRTFNLGLRERERDPSPDAKSVHLKLASDEALLQDHATLTEDHTPRSHETSLRAVVGYVLGKVIPGAVLEPGPDADVTAYWAMTNHVTNPRTETTAGFINGANVGTVGIDSASGGYPGAGQNYIYWYSTAAGESYLYVPTNASAQPGQTWSASARMRADGAGRTGRLIMHFRDVNDNLITQAVGPNVALPVAPGWATLTVSGTAPPGTVRSNLIVLHNATGPTQAVGADALMLVEGAEMVAPFYGSTPDDAHYWYEWQDVADASASTRTPVLARDPDVFIWKPGVSAWEFLSPLVTSAGMKLFCDELRVWRLIVPSDYSVPGLVSLSGAHNIAEGTDTITRNDPEVFATGVVVKYTWGDATNTVHVAYDVAGTPDKVYLVEYAQAYPGPGAAQAILARRNGSGRTQDVTAIVAWPTTPGQEASISLPGSPLQHGSVSSVQFPLGDEPLMSVGTRGLIDIPAGSWAAGTPDVTWNSVTGTWDTFTWEDQS